MPICVSSLVDGVAHLLDTETGADFTAGVANPLGGPPMVSHPLIRFGRPTSLYDLHWIAKGGILAPDEHIDPRECRHEPDPFTARAMTVVTAAELHELHERRGRPCTFMLEEATAIRNSYWEGAHTIRELAREWDVTEITIARIVHGHTYWYA